jgi:replicative DNA helicase
MTIPNNKELEEAVLGACMLESEALDMVADKLKPEIFYQPKNNTVCEAILSLLSENSPVDIMTVMTKVKDAYNASADAYYITQLTSRVNQTHNLEYYVSQLTELHVKRQLITIGQEAIKLGADLKLDCFESLDQVSQMLLDLSNNGNAKGAQKIYDCYESKVDDLEREFKGEIASKVHTGMNALDNQVKISNSDLIILAARPAMGKTAVAIQAGLNIGKGKPVLFYSREMSNAQLTDRILSNLSNVPLSKIKAPKELQPHDWEKIANASNQFNKNKLKLNDSVDLSVLGMRAEARKLQKKEGLGAIIVDYIQLLDDKGQGNREQEIARISRGLKLTAKALDVPVIALSQLSRAVEQRGGDKRPMLSDLRESGAIEQDADTVIFLYRPEYYGITEDENGGSVEGLQEMIVSKHRNGSTGTVYQKFNGAYQRIEEWQTSEVEMPMRVERNNDLKNNNDDIFGYLN